MHIVKCQGKNVRVMLSPSPSYNGPIDELVLSLSLMSNFS